MIKAMPTTTPHRSAPPHLDLGAAGVEGDDADDMRAVGGESAGRVLGVIEPQMIVIEARKRRLVNSDYHRGFSADHRGLD